MSRTKRREPKRRNHAWDAELLGKSHRHGDLDGHKNRRRREKQQLQKDLENY